MDDAIGILAILTMLGAIITGVVSAINISIYVTTGAMLVVAIFGTILAILVLWKTQVSNE